MRVWEQAERAFFYPGNRTISGRLGWVSESANEEKSENMHPELVRTVEDIENYDVIFLGYAGGIIGLN